MTPHPAAARAEHLSHPKYRADIDGLRAVAVLSVVGFHAFPVWLAGGFVGVDIFFVISGFLISTIIFENLDQNRFSFLEFYGRRVRRIFPALAVVLLACLVFGWFALLADEFAQLGEHVAAGAGFVSNLVLWSESGYFDNSSETKPLLHLWSLGIEEQFYIVWPLLIGLVHRRRKALVPATVALIGLASFAMNLGTVFSQPVAAFYSPLSRFWELLVGSGLAYVTLYHPQFGRRIGAPYASAWSIGGAALIGLALLLLDKTSAFPGWWALLPTVGAALLIFAGPQAWPNRVVLANRAMVWFGWISFPLYLWHWPLLSLARVVECGEPTRNVKIVLVLAAIVLAWLTFRLVERPLRFGTAGKAKAAGLVLVMAAIGAAGYFIFAHDGMEGHGIRSAEKSAYYNYFANVPEGRWSWFFEKDFRHECNFFPGIDKRMRRAPALGGGIDPSCYTVREPRPKLAFIWGDSNAQMLNYGLTHELPADWQVLQVASSDCPASIADEAGTADYCARSNAFARKVIAEVRPDAVVIAQKRNHDVQRMRRIAARLHELGVQRVVFTGPAPHWSGDLPKIIVRRLWQDTPERTFTDLDPGYRMHNEELKAGFGVVDGAVFVDLFACFCNEQGCLTRVGPDRKLDITTWDYGHLTAEASDFLARTALVDAVMGRAHHTP